MKKGELKLVVDKTQMFTARFTKTSALKPVFARAVNSAYSNIYICPFPTNGSKPHKFQKEWKHAGSA